MGSGTADDKGKIGDLVKKNEKKINEISKKIEDAPDSKLCKRILRYLDVHQDFDGFHLVDMVEKLKLSEGQIISSLTYMRSVNVLDQHFFIIPYTKMYIEWIFGPSEEEKND